MRRKLNRRTDSKGKNMIGRVLTHNTHARARAGGERWTVVEIERSNIYFFLSLQVLGDNA